jgi:hypothetical protein
MHSSAWSVPEIRDSVTQNDSDLDDDEFSL